MYIFVSRRSCFGAVFIEISGKKGLIGVPPLSGYTQFDARIKSSIKTLINRFYFSRSNSR